MAAILGFMPKLARRLSMAMRSGRNDVVGEDKGALNRGVNLWAKRNLAFERLPATT
jgi:hypothetical protein